MSLEGSIDDPECRERYDQRVSFMDDSAQVERLLDTERRFKRYTKISKYFNYAVTGTLALLPLWAYVNPDFDGIEKVVATTLGIFSAVAIPTLWHFGHFGDYPNLEREYGRRIDVLEQRLQDLRYNE